MKSEFERRSTNKIAHHEDIYIGKTNNSEPVLYSGNALSTLIYWQLSYILNVEGCNLAWQWDYDSLYIATKNDFLACGDRSFVISIFCEDFFK